MADQINGRGSIFQLTHLLRGATCSRKTSTSSIMISTHAPLARCDLTIYVDGFALLISTHAPLARCDGMSIDLITLDEHFNSRTSCEVRPWPKWKTIPAGAFQLTHLLRGATGWTPAAASISSFQLTHLLRGATQFSPFFALTFLFQLTHLLRGATYPSDIPFFIFNISTHAPLARCDENDSRMTLTDGQFQLTHLLRGATRFSP